MPIYEFKCIACGHVSDHLVKGYTVPLDLTCPNCGSCTLKKIISCGHYHQSDTDRLASYGSYAPRSDALYKDTRNIGLNAEQMLKRAGVKPTEEFKARLERLRTDPGSVIKDSDK